MCNVSRLLRVSKSVVICQELIVQAIISLKTLSKLITRNEKMLDYFNETNVLKNLKYISFYLHSIYLYLFFIVVFTRICNIEKTINVAFVVNVLMWNTEMCRTCVLIPPAVLPLLLNEPARNNVVEHVSCT